MADDDDWERALEEDRKRMAAGEDVGGRCRGRDDDDPDVAQYASMMAYTAEGDAGLGRAVASAAATSSAVPPSSADELASVEAFYAQYEAQQSTPAQAGGGPRTCSGPGVVTMQAGFRATFGGKFGRRLYFCETVSMYVKGFFSPNVESFVCFVTPGGVYFGDPDTGELPLGRAFANLVELLVLGESGIGLRFRASHDVCLTVPVGRGNFVAAVSHLAGSSVMVSTRSAEYEKGYRKDIKYVSRKDFEWDVFEDPRTGLPLVHVPEKHVPFYFPVVPKILHWFGGLNYITKDWKGSLVQERRGAWITATTMYLCFPSGPQVDGRDITKCVGIEFLGEVFNGAGGGLALVTSAGPKQPPLTLMFDDMQTKERVIGILREIFAFRKGTELKVTRTDSIDKSIKIEKARDKKEKPELFVMKTREDLLALLRSKATKR